ncbi:HD-GYP domain [Chitinispirillum alkaliphilum]|nr:HD-GYP domain [Chitinispirillum alkaliphilum]
MSSEEKRILVVDDEKAICDILSQYLSAGGFSVKIALSGPEAIDIIQKLNVDMVITDLHMPQMSGVELLKWVKEYDSTIPVMFTTGYPALSSAIEGLRLGACDYITKPFHLEEIGEKVKRVLKTKRVEEENLLFSKLVSLHEVTKVLSATLQTSELNRKLLHYSTRIIKADSGALFFLNSKSKLVLSSCCGCFSEEYWSRREFIEASIWVVDNQEPLVIEAAAENSHRLPPELSSYIVFPLKAHSTTSGVLNVLRTKDKPYFSNLDLEIFNVLASQASISIDNARLYQSSRNNYLKTIRAFALAVEAKDQYTHGHSENVMKYTVRLARHLGLSESEIELVKYAGLLHDIGKIGVSELIINKPGKLTTQEFDEIKKHPGQGARIISDVPSLKDLVPLVYHHHEFYCGGGYPSGIAGKEIPYGARILSIADAFEAMTSNRPYRKSLPEQVAFDILKKEKGKQFDPEMVDAFLDIMNRNK